jgi:hypothetical protein
MARINFRSIVPIILSIYCHLKLIIRLTYLKKELPCLRLKVFDGGGSRLCTS